MDAGLFEEDDSENELDFKTNNVFAKNYDKWRSKEELHKLQTKYGPDAKLPDMDSESSDSESEDETLQLSEKFEKDFLKTLSLLKDKDPRIYDSTFNFFGQDIVQPIKSDASSSEKHKPIKVRDYERQVILKKGKLDEEDSNDEEVAKSQPYVEEQRQLKEKLTSFLNDDDNDDDDGDAKLAGLFIKRQKSKNEEEEEEKSYREWLKGQSEHLNDEKEENDLKALKQFWSKPDLGEKDAFLRDYILNRRYIDDDNNGYIPSYEEIVHDSDGNLSDDEETIKQQVTFERKYNFRFEEPDPEFIKKYPRTIENTMRQQSNKRALKRQETKQRKTEEKQKKFEEIGRLKSMKLKEIKEKIAKLKEITGNDQLAFEEADIMEDFDPEAHDKRMKELFDESYYQDQDVEKPEFPDLDGELEIEKWDKFEEESQNLPINKNDSEAHCEDEDFNMDCDYDPSKENEKAENDLQELGTKRRKKKRRSKLAEILAADKPKYDPLTADKTYADYMDEYYKIDCEDIIGDLPCRFKYTQTVPNDYGLTIEEILLADDKELNQWYSIKKSQKNKPEYQERGEVKAYKKRAENIKLKRKYLPSLFRNIEEDPEEKPDIVNTVNVQTKKKKKKKKKNKPIKQIEFVPDKEIGKELAKINDHVINGNVSEAQKNSVVSDLVKKKKNSIVEDKDHNASDAQSRNEQSNVSTLNGNSQTNNRKRKHSQDVDNKIIDMGAKKRKKRHGKNKAQNKNFLNSGTKRQSTDPLHSLSDERLKAYGLNPKKYKNFLKFKKY